MNFPLAWGPGPWELVIIGGIALLLFGTRLPTLARSFGQSVTEFKKGMKEIREDVEEDVDSKDSKKKDEE